MTAGLAKRRPGHAATPHPAHRQVPASYTAGRREVPGQPLTIRRRAR